MSITCPWHLGVIALNNNVEGVLTLTKTVSKL